MPLRDAPTPFRHFGRFPFFEDMESELMQNWPTYHWPSLASQAHQFGGISIKSDAKNLAVEFDMPGLKEEDIDVSIDNGVLYVKGEAKEEKREKKGDEKIYRQASRSFTFRIALPEQIDASKEPKASYSNGVLQITFNKATPSQSKQIKVQKGQKE